MELSDCGCPIESVEGSKEEGFIRIIHCHGDECQGYGHCYSHVWSRDMSQQEAWDLYNLVEGI